MNGTSHDPPMVSPWLWAETFGETMAAGVDPVGIARRLRDQRLASLMQVAMRSPLYRRRLDSGSKPFTSLEPIDKAELMHRFDEWATDRRITLDSVQGFIEDTGRLADAYLGQYLVWTSSGTTGKPGIFVQDARSLAVFGALDALRLRGAPQGLLPLTTWSMGQRFAFVGATGGHFAGAASIERLKRLVGAATPGPLGWFVPQVRTFSVQTPLRELANDLQSFSPTVLITYPSCAAALAQLQTEAALQLRLSEVWVGGEQLSDAQRAQIGHTFGCALRNNYGASEFFSIAFECERGHLHLNDDWVILEPVDSHGQRVPAGELSHAVWLTNLANHAQPLLRYRLDDAIRFAGVACPCGCKFPVIEVQGRSADTLVLHDAHDRAVTVLPLALETAIENGARVTQFQVLCRAPDALELRLQAEEDPRLGNFARVRAALVDFLCQHGLENVRIERGREALMREGNSGKLRRVRLAPTGAER